MEKITFEYENNHENHEHHEHHTNPEKHEHHHKVKKVSRFRFYFLNIFLFLVIALVAGGLFVYFFCNLETVSYEGVENSLENEIADALFSDIKYENTVYVWGYELFKKHPNAEFINRTSVKITGLNSIKVSVIEKELNGVIPTDENNVYFDKDGKVTEISERLIDGIPVVNGVEPEEPKIGEAVSSKGYEIKISCDLIKYMSNTDYSVDEIVFNPNGTFGFYSSEIFVNLGTSENLQEKVRRIPYIFEQIPGKTGEFHLEDWSSENKDIIFEEY